MNSFQTMTIRLIEEIDAICKDEGIEYCATDALAWGAVHDGRFAGAAYESTLLMNEIDIERFASVVVEKGAPARQLVGNVCDGKGRRLSKYEATDTTFIDLCNIDDSGCYGMSIKIRPVRKVDGGFEFDGPLGNAVHVDANPIDELKMLGFETIRIPVPADTKAFLTAILGVDELPESYPVARFGLGHYAITHSDSIPYADFLAEYEGIDEIELVAENPIGKLVEWGDVEYQSMVKLVDADDMIDRVSAVRFRLFERYFPRKERLLSAWREGRKELVASAYSDYVWWVKEFYGSGYTLYFDAELFELLKDVLRHEGWEGADKLDALVFERHRNEPLEEVFGKYM